MGYVQHGRSPRDGFGGDLGSHKEELKLDGVTMGSQRLPVRGGVSAVSQHRGGSVWEAGAVRAGSGWAGAETPHWEGKVRKQGPFSWPAAGVGRMRGEHPQR